jgi:hypothetical protein
MRVKAARPRGHTIDRVIFVLKEDAMTRTAAPAAAPPPPEEPPVEAAELLREADGWYWRSRDAREQAGPFASAAEALADAQAALAGAEPGALLREVEQQIGVADWIDPDSDGPAEDFTPHIEEH